MKIDATSKAYASAIKLTKREHQVLVNLLMGNNRPEDIADKLAISVSTVNNHLKNIYVKTNCSGKPEVIADFLAFVAKHGATPISNRRKILILDNEPDMNLMVKNYLSMHGIECHAFTDPILAITQLKKLKIDLILADYKMPKMNGLEFLAEIRKSHRSEPRVIFITAYSSAQVCSELLEAGAIAVIEKPFTIEMIVQTVFGIWASDLMAEEGLGDA